MNYKILVIFLLLSLLCSCSPIDNSAELLSEKQIVEQANMIAKSYCKNHLSAVLLNADERKRASESTEFDNMSVDDRILLLRQKNTFSKMAAQDEIQAIFRIFLYLEERKTEVNVIAITYSYTSGGIDNTQFMTTTISRQSFAELYKESNIAKKNEKETANLLAQNWKIKNNYQK